MGLVATAPLPGAWDSPSKDCVLRYRGGGVCQVWGENPDRARFCLGCGAALVDQSAAREMRKTVTVLFCDLSGPQS